MTTSPALRRFRRNKAALWSSWVLVAFCAMAAFAPWLSPYGPLEQDLENNYQGPSAAHPLGTDDLGRDTWSRLAHGSRVSLGIAVSSVLVGVLIGAVLGLVAAFYGGLVDSSIMRFMDVLLAMPGILLGIAIVVVLGNGVINTVIAVAVFSVPTFARLVRGSALAVLELDYIMASRALGASSLRIMFGHVVPNSLTPLIVQSTLQLGSAILIASGLSFLGLGVQPPNPEWGAMLSKGRELVRATPVAAVAPGLAITLVVLSFSLVGDGLRDALDPKLRR